MKIEEFDKMVNDFLAPLDDDRSEEYYQSEWARASAVMTDLRKHLYKADMDKHERYEQYLKLKAEFGSEGYTR